MAGERKTDFCINCRRKTEYYLIKKAYTGTIRGKAYTFPTTTAVCTVCGEEMSVPGLMDLNLKEIDDQYRAAEDIITTEEIRNLVSQYGIGEGSLSVRLGLKESAITHFLEGQVPSKACSDTMKSAERL